MKWFRVQIPSFLFFFLLLAGPSASAANASPRFSITLAGNIRSDQKAGRLYLVFSETNSPEPRMLLGHTGRVCPQAMAQEVTNLMSGKPEYFDNTCFSFPITNVSMLPRREYFVQAVFDSNRDFRSVGSPGNLYSEIERVLMDSSTTNVIKLLLSHKIPPELLPPETDQIKFIKIRSGLLSVFHHRPIYLRAGIVLPHDYDVDPSQRFPVWIRIAGLNSRCSVVQKLMDAKSDFYTEWNAKETPRFILVQLDGAGPLGDPYYVNSANSGPYGDALMKELLPAIEERFRVSSKPDARVLSGVSTGGWVALALQIFYPDLFSGVWASCPDPVDFRALERLNIYEEPNAYVDCEGHQRPSERNAKGEAVLAMRQEVGAERLLGRFNNFTTSGEQWGEWTAAFSPRGSDGLPVPLWNAETGEINTAVAEKWRKFDLHLVLEKNWQTLGPKLKGKLHIASGEADQFFLNDAVHLLEDFLKKTVPPAEAKIVYGIGKGHGWSNLTPKRMLLEMAEAVK